MVACTAGHITIVEKAACVSVVHVVVHVSGGEQSGGGRSVCPDVSQSMEREGNGVEVDGQCVLMSVSQWKEKGTVWRWTVSLCQCVLMSVSRWREKGTVWRWTVSVS